MLAGFAEKAASFYVEKGVISREDQEVYSYSFEVLFSTILNVVVIILIAVLSRQFTAVAAFSVVFILMRRNAGGYHAETHLGCTSILIFVLITYLAAVRYLTADIKTICFIGFLGFAVPVIFSLAPVEHPNNPLYDKSKITLRRNAILIFCISACVSILSFFYFRELSFYISAGIFVAAVSALAEHIRHIVALKNVGRRINKYEEDS